MYFWGDLFIKMICLREIDRETRKMTQKHFGKYGDAVVPIFRVRRRRFRVFSGKKMMEPGTPQRIV